MRNFLLTPSVQRGGGATQLWPLALGAWLGSGLGPWPLALGTWPLNPWHLALGTWPFALGLALALVLGPTLALDTWL